VLLFGSLKKKSYSYPKEVLGESSDSRIRILSVSFWMKGGSDKSHVKGTY
jgi:hypothetical protein